MNFSEFKIELIQDSVELIEMNDETYFSEKYKEYVSNSRLALINPAQGGSPKLYNENIKQGFNPSFTVGTAVHELVLQSELFVLSDYEYKPSAKLGAFIDGMFKYRDKGHTIYDSMLQSSEDFDYYANKLSEKRIKTAIQKGLKYYLAVRNGLLHDDFRRSVIVLSKSHMETCKQCVASVKKNKDIQKLIKDYNETSLIPRKSLNEAAIFAEVKITFPFNSEHPEQGNHSTVLKVKMKADNFFYDDFIISLNDLKTTGKPLPYFTDTVEYSTELGKNITIPGSFTKYHYARQMAMYLWLVKSYVNKPSASMEANMMVVETLPNYKSEVVKVSVADIKNGFKEMKELLCRVAYCEINGYEDE